MSAIGDPNKSNQSTEKSSQAGHKKSESKTLPHDKAAAEPSISDTE
jgi:hypothetical protein